MENAEGLWDEKEVLRGRQDPGALQGGTIKKEMMYVCGGHGDTALQKAGMEILSSAFHWESKEAEIKEKKL